VAHLSVVIPVYRAEGCLPELYRRLGKALSQVTRNYEIVMVEDCGGDGSWDILKGLAAKDKRVKAIRLTRNFGQHYAITAGLDHADGDWVVVMDCDLQDRPEEIPRLYAKAQEGHEVVLARRVERRDPALKRATSWIFYKLFTWLSGLPYDGSVGNFRIFSRQVADEFRGMREHLRFFGGLMEWIGFPAASIDVRHDPRFAGKTSYTYAKLVRLALEAMIAYSDKPLRMAVQAGFWMSLLSFLGAAVIFYRALAHNISIAGWGSLMVSLYFIGGLIIAILGVVGLYLGKTFSETKKRPLYIIREAQNLSRRRPA